MKCLGTWNIRGVNGEEERKEVVDVFLKGEIEVLIVTETKMKRKGENEWCGMKFV